MQLMASKKLTPKNHEELVQFSCLLNEKCSRLNLAETDIWMYQFAEKDWASVLPNLHQYAV